MCVKSLTVPGKGIYHMCRVKMIIQRVPGNFAHKMSAKHYAPVFHYQPTPYNNLSWKQACNETNMGHNPGSWLLLSLLEPAYTVQQSRSDGFRREQLFATEDSKLERIRLIRRVYMFMFSL